MNIEDIKQKVDKFDIVSFDIFDTLITRLVLHPVDVFRIVNVLSKQRLDINFDLFIARTEAEKRLLNSSKKYDYNLHDIYNSIKIENQLSDNTTDELMKIELEVEKKVTICRKDVLDLYSELYESGKKIILVSDMYLSVEQIKQLLSKSGYKTDNVDIYISNEFKAVKSNGSLWDIVSKKYTSKKVIHIGDNYRSDCYFPKKYKIDIIEIKSSLDKFMSSKMYSTLSKYEDGSVGTSILLGRLCNELLFNNAFSFDFCQDKSLGFLNGPVFSCFMRWLIRNRDDSLLLFVTREGYIFQPMYQIYCEIAGIEQQKNCLFFTSRQAVARASIRNSDDLKDLLSMKYEGTLFGFIKHKCGNEIDCDAISDRTISLPKEKEIVYRELQPIISELIKTSKIAMDTYNKYIEKCCSDNHCDNLTIVDIGYLGTIQYLLTKITSKRIIGKYLITDTDVYPQIKDNVYSLGKTSENLHPIHDNIQFFESSIQVSYGQLTKIKEGENGVFVFEFNNAKQTAEDIKNAQEQCLQFAITDAQWFKYLGYEYDYSLNLAEDAWMCLIYYNYLPESFINCFCYDDDFNGNEKLKYNSKLHVFETGTEKIPFVFYKSRNKESQKQMIKNMVKNYTPSFLYSPLKSIWMKFLK